MRCKLQWLDRPQALTVFITLCIGKFHRKGLFTGIYFRAVVVKTTMPRGIPWAQDRGNTPFRCCKNVTNSMVPAADAPVANHRDWGRDGWLERFSSSNSIVAEEIHLDR